MCLNYEIKSKSCKRPYDISSRVPRVLDEVSDPSHHCDMLLYISKFVCRNSSNDEISSPQKLFARMKGPKVFTRQMAYYERKYMTENNFSRNCREDVFDVTFWDLCSAILIDSMRSRKEFLWRFWGFSSFPHWNGTKRWFCEFLVEPHTSQLILWWFGKRFVVIQKITPFGTLWDSYIDSSHHEIEFRVPDVRATSFGGT